MPTSTTPSLNSAELAITAWAPASSTARARSTDRMPPPTRQGSRRQMSATSDALSPRPRAASRSISWTRGNVENFWIHGSASGASIASRLALHELDDVAVLKVDRWNQHLTVHASGFWLLVRVQVRFEDRSGSSVHSVRSSQFGVALSSEFAIRSSSAFERSRSTVRVEFGVPDHRRIGMPCACRCRFRSATLDSA